MLPLGAEHRAEEKLGLDAIERRGCLGAGEAILRGSPIEPVLGGVLQVLPTNRHVVFVRVGAESSEDSETHIGGTLLLEVAEALLAKSRLLVSCS